ncbi:hypothetical protein ACOME3_001917 [Neoechinorhynchus agilis]
MRPRKWASIINIAEIAVGIVVLVVISLPQKCEYFGGNPIRLLDHGLIMSACSISLYTLTSNAVSNYRHQRCLALWNLCTGAAVLAVAVLLLIDIRKRICIQTFAAGSMAAFMAVLIFLEGILRFLGAKTTIGAA